MAAPATPATPATLKPSGPMGPEMMVVALPMGGYMFQPRGAGVGAIHGDRGLWGTLDFLLNDILHHPKDYLIIALLIALLVQRSTPSTPISTKA